VLKVERLGAVVTAPNPLIVESVATAAMAAAAARVPAEAKVVAAQVRPRAAPEPAVLWPDSEWSTEGRESQADRRKRSRLDATLRS